VATKEFATLLRSDSPDDSHRLLDGERDTLPSSTELPKAPPFDAELPADAFDLTRRRPAVAGDVSRVDAGRSPVIHNAFWVAGKVPSLNDLLSAKSGGSAPILSSLIMRYRPGKGKQRGARFNLYNDIKQDWKRRTIKAIGTPFVRVAACYFGYVVVEETLKRDPSNICSAAIKFIEDGLVEAGVIPNDSWGNVLGIRMVCVHRKGRDPGVYVVMSDTPLPEACLVGHYEESLPLFLEP
jgi:hypothetical protein